MTTITLAECHKGECGSIEAIDACDGVQKCYRRKLLSMGATPGTRFKVLRVAPLGDPIEIKLRGFHLSLRKSEAGAVKVSVDRETVAWTDAVYF